MVRCKHCKKTIKSTGCTGKHCWNHGNCMDCHYLGFYNSKTIKYNKLDVY